MFYVVSGASTTVIRHDELALSPESLRVEDVAAALRAETKRR